MIMDSQLITDQIINNNYYSLQLCTQGATLTIKLMVKVSDRNVDVYQITLNSLKDVDKLGDSFDNLADFKQYIKDVNNIDVVLSKKTIRVLTISQIKNMKKTIQIATISLNFFNSIEKDLQNEFLQQILDRCSSKEQYTNQQVKLFLENIAMYLSELKKQNKRIKQEQDDSIKNLISQVEVNKQQFLDIYEKDEQFVNHMKNMKQKLKKFEAEVDTRFSQTTQLFDQRWKKQLEPILMQLNAQEKNLNQEISKMKEKMEANRLNCEQKQSFIQYQLEGQGKEILNRCFIEDLNLETEKIYKQIEEIKKKMEKDINVLGMRLQNIEKPIQKQIEKNDSNHRQIRSKSNSNYFQQLQTKGVEKKNNLDIRNWVDSNCKHFNDLALRGNTITARNQADVFGKNKIVRHCIFTASFLRIGNYVRLGVIDILNRNGQRNKNYIFYQSNSWCRIGAAGCKKGNGFRIEENVTVAIDLNSGGIQWSVGSQIRHQQIVPMLRDTSIAWVPYIYLNNQDDSVEIIEV